MVKNFLTKIIFLNYVHFVFTDLKYRKFGKTSFKNNILIVCLIIIFRQYKILKKIRYFILLSVENKIRIILYSTFPYVCCVTVEEKCFIQ